ncbi:hypothetical protein FA10DRAFT_267907 [Acaromyces ingoldii]|uniref:Ras modification protein ERF4 n=1 Tax=Acaromyces ingoldii TaxID=215250 RepID=A0A316YJF6_9BASI|nr:hypothetical protein FA10DRAFT_267907 [Acaromyces ingoldii]PWN89331.1 hypothetical protein FA10DRAFT_267907 [Acaromyces ingoldii]
MSSSAQDPLQTPRRKEGEAQVLAPAGGSGAGPKSSYYQGPPAQNSAFGTAPIGVIGRDKPREIIRVERDYTGGELCQFHPTFPLELEGRVEPTVFSETMNDINELLIKAHDPSWACFDNSLAVLTLYTSPFLLNSKYEREMKRLDKIISQANEKSFNPAGLNIRSPAESAFLFLEVEYF